MARTIADTGDRRAETIDLRDPQERERGRHANAPHEIPARGWKDVATRVKDESKDDKLTLIGGGIAFFALLSLAPAMVAAISLYGLIASPDDIARHLNDVSSVMPDDARRLVTDQLNAVVASSRAGLSFGFILGLLTALWGASTAMKHLLVALTTIYDEHESRSYLGLRSRAFFLTLLGIVFVGVTVLLLTVVPSWVDNGNSAAELAVSILRWPVLLVLMMVALAFLYRYAPDRDEPRWRWVSWGAVIATVLWLVASVGFSFYASHFGSYNKTYGSMGAVIVTMLWLWITALCVLLGGEINAELEHQTARDSTRGPEQPPGRRDAYVADTVGAARSR